MCVTRFSSFFFFNDTATTEIYTLSLHDALPIEMRSQRRAQLTDNLSFMLGGEAEGARPLDRKSTRLNSSYMSTSYAVFCLKKKKGAAPKPRTTGESPRNRIRR